MTASLYLLLPISVLFVIAIGAMFWWAIFAGQFDDTERAAHSILLDDDTTLPSPTEDSDASGSETVQDKKNNVGS